MVDLRQMLLTHYDGVHEGDFDKALSVFTEDVERTMAGAGILHGLDAFRAVIRVFPDAFPEIEFEVHRWIEAGDWPVVEGRVQGTHTGPLRTPEGETPATGKRLDLPFVDVLQARGNKFCRLHVYFDRLEMMSQLGVIPGRS